MSRFVFFLSSLCILAGVILYHQTQVQECLLLSMAGWVIAWAIIDDNLLRQRWRWPLPTRDPLPTDVGAFGALRKHEVHTGVDLYAPVGTPVRAVADGYVLLVTPFTGDNAGSPWWNTTQAVLVAHNDGVVVYGEIEPCVQEDRRVSRGQIIGTVMRVRKQREPSSMLHLELWSSLDKAIYNYTGARALIASDWLPGEKRPKGLLDPTPYLKRAEG